MKFTVSTVAGFLFFASSVQGQGNEMVKLCLFYPNESGHARSDPIINQNCASGHVHTFYGPQNFHPNTSYEDLRDTPAKFSSTPFVENQSLYWHPSIYRVTDDGSGTKTFTRVNNLDTSPYYRWDKSNAPEVVAFPPGFRMIAHSDDAGANQGGESGANMMTECCDMGPNGEEQCESWGELRFPTRTCSFLGIAMSMPTCWNGSSLGDDNDHKSHITYTTNGEVNGPCPPGFDKRLPQVQLFVRINDYQGGTYQLSDGASVWHVDFFNGWKEGKLQELIDTCEPDRSAEAGTFNPPCTCSEKLTKNTQVAGAVCDSDVRRLIIDEATDVTSQLPMGSCEGPTLIPKSWTQLNDSTIQCTMPPGTIDDESENGDEDGGAAEDGDEDSAAASDEEPGEGQASDEGDSIEASDEEEEEASGDGEEFDEGDGNVASDEEGSNDGGEASDEGDSNEASEEEEEGSSDGEEASDEGETEEEEDSNDEGEENIFDSEDEVESEEEEFDESEEEPFSLVRGSNLGNSQSCHLTCMNSFNICQSSITAKCETYFEACKSECHEAEAIGEIAEDELSTCLDEWCMDDKDICYSEAETRCQRRRTNCLRKC